MKTWLVTGAGGFLGRHVLDRLRLETGDRVIALARRPRDSRSSKIGWIGADLADAGAVALAVANVRPTHVLHLAGRTPPASSADLYRANVAYTAHLTAALARLPGPVRLVVAGSASEVGPVPPACLPVDERTAMRPEGAYGLSKWAASVVARTIGGRVETVVGRIFNPIGPGMPGTQVFGRFARVLAEAGGEPITLRTGDLEARRDFVDVRDVADGLVRLADRGQAGRIYHLGAGGSRGVREGLDVLVKLSGRVVRVEESTAVGSSRPADSVASVARMAEDTGWAPVISFEKSLEDHWREVVAGRSLALMPAAPAV
jgi:GDP-4-dehydro-6-deoxy-D-mannose reductase